MKISTLKKPKISTSKIRKKYCNVPALLMVFAITAYFFRFMLDWNFNIQSLIWFFAAFVPFVYVAKRDFRIVKKLIPFIVVDFIALINMMVNGSHAPIYIGILFATQWWGAFLYYERRRLQPLELISILFILYLLYLVWTTPKSLINSWQYGIILSSLVRQNTVSIFLCEFLTYILLNRYFTNRNTPHWLFFVSLLTAVICGGMGGLLSTTAYFVGELILNRKSDKINWRIVILFLLAAVAFFVFFGNINSIIKEVTDDNGRWYIWRNYYPCIDSSKDLIFGADVSSVPFLKTANNMHNTFINYHFCYGLVPFLFFLWRHIKNFKYCIKEKKHLLLIIMLVTTLRALTDEADFAFGGIWTFIWLMSEFETTSKKKSSNKRSNRILEQPYINNAIIKGEYNNEGQIIIK